MGKAAREKWERRLLALRSALARSPSNPDAKSHINGWVVVMASTILALASLPSDEILTTLPILTIAGIGYIYAVATSSLSAPLKRFAGLLTLVVFLWFGYHAVTKGIESRRLDAYGRLELSMGGIEPNAYAYMMYTIKNGSSTSIAGYRVTCIVNKLADTKNSGFVIAPAGNPGPWIKGGLKAFDGVDTSRCSFVDHIALNGPIACIDLTMRVDYQPSIWGVDLQHKSFRFVAAKGNGHHWYPVSAEFPGNFCDGASSPVFSTETP